MGTRAHLIYSLDYDEDGISVSGPICYSVFSAWGDMQPVTGNGDILSSQHVRVQLQRYS